MREKVLEFNDDWKRFLDSLNKWKKNNLEAFCLNKCKGYECCRDMEHSGLEEAQIREIFKLKESDSLTKPKNRYGLNVIRKDKKGFYTDLCHGVPCPALGKNNMCTIYNSPLKPHYCDDFPFYYSRIDGVDTLEIDMCPATKSLDLNEVKRMAEKSGLKISYVKKITDI